MKALTNLLKFLSKELTILDFYTNNGEQYRGNIVEVKRDSLIIDAPGVFDIMEGRHYTYGGKGTHYNEIKFKDIKMDTIKFNLSNDKGFVILEFKASKPATYSKDMKKSLKSKIKNIFHKSK